MVYFCGKTPQNSFLDCCKSTRYVMKCAQRAVDLQKVNEKSNIGNIKKDAYKFPKNYSERVSAKQVIAAFMS